MSEKVSLPNSLLEQIRTRVRESEFSSEEEYIVFVLSEVVNQRPELGESASSAGNNDREEAVRQNLQSLGYLE